MHQLQTWPMPAGRANVVFTLRIAKPCCAPPPPSPRDPEGCVASCRRETDPLMSLWRIPLAFAVRASVLCDYVAGMMHSEQFLRIVADTPAAGDVESSNNRHQVCLGRGCIQGDAPSRVLFLAMVKSGCRLAPLVPYSESYLRLAQQDTAAPLCCPCEKEDSTTQTKATNPL